MWPEFNAVRYVLSVVCLLCIQDDEEDFEHLNDEDEFEGFDKERTPKKSHEQPPDLKITKVYQLIALHNLLV